MSATRQQRMYQACKSQGKNEGRYPKAGEGGLYYPPPPLPPPPNSTKYIACRMYENVQDLLWLKNENEHFIRRKIGVLFVLGSLKTSAMTASSTIHVVRKLRSCDLTCLYCTDPSTLRKASK